MKRFLNNSRLHLLLLAFSLFIISTIFSLSAYLSDKQTYVANLRTASSKDLGFAFTGTQYDDQIIDPGETLSLPIGVEVTGNYHLYVFIQYDPSAGLVINGFNSTAWHPIADGSNIYYYGTDSGLVTLDSTNPTAPIFTSVTLPVEARKNEPYPINITGYAIDKNEIPASASIADIFEMAKTNSDSRGN